jgi:glycosyltransferase involved in cell wall biosynthesis
VRIVLIAPPWLPVPPPAYGGIEFLLDQLARGLRSSGHDVLLFATGDSRSEVTTRWVLPSAAGTLGNGSATEIRHVVHAYDEAVQFGAEIVHDHTLVGPLYGTRFGIPIVTTNHGPFNSELHACYRAISGRVPIVAISEHHAASAGEIPVAAAIHHGVDLSDFPLGDGRGGYAAFVGRLSADKGVADAARIARAAGVPLKIAGKCREPAEIEYFRDSVEPLLGTEVEYLGEVGGTDKIDLLAGATCLLNPIAWPEPFGMVMVEALACGTPVVATPYGSVPEIVVDGVNGFVRATEPELARALGCVDELDRAACRSVVETRFSADLMVARHVELYRRVCAEGQPLRAA